MLSVLIPTYNYRIVTLVKQVKQQCDALGILYEIIAADDFSDNVYTEENRAINSFANCRLIENEHNRGRTYTRRILAQKAQYDMLLFLDADVLPVKETFIKNYLKYAADKAPAVFGGYAYTPEPPEKNRILRYKYGKCREEKPVYIRKQNPYGFVFSGNILLRKDVFMENNFNGEGKFYGLDVWFSYSLFRSGVPVIQIDNPIYHLGIEENEVFFKKALDSVATKKELMESFPEIGMVNPLMKSYRLLQKYRLTAIIKAGFKLTEPLLRKMILKNNPSLFILDIYRLGYLCSL
jgi:glycosyltransferase involved in cell wall biosynthesis